MATNIHDVTQTNHWLQSLRNKVHWQTPLIAYKRPKIQAQANQPNWWLAMAKLGLALGQLKPFNCK